MKRAKNQFFRTITVEQALKMGPRRFVKEYLFPAMRREHGNGFAMETWHRDARVRDVNGLDDIDDRKAPACNSVMCIGGTIQAITGAKAITTMSRILGLPDFFENTIPAETLFYEWLSNRGAWKGLSTAFLLAHTPREKERIAEKAVLAGLR